MHTRIAHLFESRPMLASMSRRRHRVIVVVKRQMQTVAAGACLLCEVSRLVDAVQQPLVEELRFDCHKIAVVRYQNSDCLQHGPQRVHLHHTVRCRRLLQTVHMHCK